MQGTLVTVEITPINKKENRTIDSPIIPKTKVFFAPSSFLESPAEVMYLAPPIMNITRAAVPANAKRAARTFKKIMGTQLSVATSLITFPAVSFCFAHSPQALNIIRE